MVCLLRLLFCSLLVLSLACQFVNSFSASTKTTKGAVPSRYSWEDRIHQLKEFRTKNGHCRVANSDNPSLYQWTRTVRKLYNADSLGEDKKAQLDSLDFCWNLQEYAWEKNYQQLRIYHLIHKNCRVSNTNLDYPGLGVWVRNQRREYRKLVKNLPHTLTNDRLHKLELLGFEWSRNRNQTWGENYKQLVVYKAQHNHVNVPQNTSLGKWCMNQRTYYRRNMFGERTSLTPSRIDRLEALGFSWNLRNSIWRGNVQQLKQYHDEHGHVNIPVSDTSRTYLRLWLTLQRFKYHTQQLSQHRIETLESTIPEFQWRARQRTSPSNKDWANLFKAMRDLGISSQAPPRAHFFDGKQRFDVPVKDTWTEQDLLDLWNSDEDEDDDDH